MDVPISNTFDMSVDGTLSAAFIGQRGNLRISSATSFAVEETFVLTTVTLRNMGTERMTDVMYYRVADPDIDAYMGGFYYGEKYVVANPYRPADGTSRVWNVNPNGACVMAVGALYNTLSLGFATVNEFARVNHGPWYTTPTASWESNQWTLYTQSSRDTSDDNIQLA